MGMAASPQPQVSKIDFLGLSLSDLDTPAAARVITSRNASLDFVYVVTPNAQHMVSLAHGDVAWRQAYQSPWLVLSDGQVVRRLARLILGRSLPHASGSDLTRQLLSRHIRPDDPVTVIGGNAKLEAALIARFGLTRLALYAPPFGFIDHPAEVEACLAFLDAHPARYVFFAVGAPQSELLARLAKDRGTLRGIGLCIGSSLLFATGLVKRAPRWMQWAGLESLYRLGQRPRSHLRRIFIESLPVVWIILRAKFGGPGILPPGRSEAP